MASGVSDYGAVALLSAIFKIDHGISNYYVALCTGQPGVAMDGDVLADLEPVDGFYVRAHYSAGSGYWAATNAYATNTQAISFGVAALDWGLLTHYALCTAPTGGELIAWGELLSPVFVQSGYSIALPVGGIVVTLSALDSPITV